MNETEKRAFEVNRLVHDLAVEAAKVSLSREKQNDETDPAKLASTLYAHYTTAKRQLMGTLEEELCVGKEGKDRMVIR